jgi:hypothetical protein
MKHEYMIVYLNNEDDPNQKPRRMVNHADIIDQALHQANAALTRMCGSSYTILSITQED